MSDITGRSLAEAGMDVKIKTGNAGDSPRRGHQTPKEVYFVRNSLISDAHNDETRMFGNATADVMQLPDAS